MLQNIDRNDELRFQNRQGPQWGWNYPDALFVGKAQCDIFHLILTIFPLKWLLLRGCGTPLKIFSCPWVLRSKRRGIRSVLSKEELHTKISTTRDWLLKPTNFEIHEFVYQVSLQIESCFAGTFYQHIGRASRATNLMKH